ncbi:MAG TPA: 23S rRNA (adenine(2503)-C(2))-methyltransferase RlmN [Porphyromonadaceae bacterium]|nr:23S rRNA (adenine(2503)-C(2))-methyltransferase RlmN [Porphyromonadaceae bacterium]
MEFLFGKTLEELQEVAERNALPRYAGKQLAEWIYKKRCTDLSQITNVSLSKREELAKEFSIGRTAPSLQMESIDGTIKYLFPCDTPKFSVESVYIPEKERATLCVSSQVGCKMNCHFCHTGRMGFKSNLSAREILNQIYSIPFFEKLTNVVFMGMGEPFDNTDAVMKVLSIMTSPWGMAWSPRRITVSSIGVTKGLLYFLDKSECNLAISLHNPFPEERVLLMPTEKSFPIKETIQLLKRYDFSHQRRLSFEYTMFAGINDTLKHAKALLDLIKGMNARVNLIRFHESKEMPYRCAEERDMIAFRDYLNNHSILSTIRTSRGEDIMAACGMLSCKEGNKQR